MSSWALGGVIKGHSAKTDQIPVSMSGGYIVPKTALNKLYGYLAPHDVDAPTRRRLLAPMNYPELEYLWEMRD